MIEQCISFHFRSKEERVFLPECPHRRRSVSPDLQREVGSLCTSDIRSIIQLSNQTKTSLPRQKHSTSLLVEHSLWKIYATQGLRRINHVVALRRLPGRFPFSETLPPFSFPLTLSSSVTLSRTRNVCSQRSNGACGNSYHIAKSADILRGFCI